MVKILEINNLSYKNFNDLSISFMSNFYYSIIGPNNCGKTTLFKLIAGIIPSNDVICCNNTILNDETIMEYIINLGIVERVNKNSFTYKSVIDEMMYPLRNLGFNKKDSLKRINNVLELFNQESFLDKEINNLSYYEKQLLLIIIALLHQPKVLLLDSVLQVFPYKMKDKINKVLRKILQ